MIKKKDKRTQEEKLKNIQQKRVLHLLDRNRKFHDMNIQKIEY